MDGINNFSQIPNDLPKDLPKATDVPHKDILQKAGEASPLQAGATPSPAEATTQPAVTPMPPEVLAEILLGYGYKSTEENKAMLKLMLENGLPLTKESIARMNQALKLTQTPQKALFMLQNNIKLTDANAELLEKLVNGQAKITDKLTTLANVIEQVKDPNVKAQLQQILAGEATGKAAGESSGGAISEQAPAGGEAAKATQTPAQSTVLQPSQPQSPTQPTAQSQPNPSTQPSSQPAQTPPPTLQQPASQLKATPAQSTPTQSQTNLTQSTTPQPQSTQNPIDAQSQSIAKSTSQSPPPTSFAQQPHAPQSATAQNNATPLPSTQQSHLAKALEELQTIQGTKAAERLAQAVQPSQASQTAPSAQISAPPTLPANLLFSVQQSTPQSLENYIQGLRETLSQITQALSGNDSLDAFRVLAHTRSVEASLDFSSHIRDQIFVQIPISYNGHTAETTLHVYRDPKKAASDSDSASALIALDTAALGHFETFVQKNAQSVRCQFRLESEEMVALVRENIHKLGTLLREGGYSLEAFSFLPPGVPYTVLSGPNGDNGDDSSDGLLRYNRLV